MAFSIEYVYKLIDKYSDTLKSMGEHAKKFGEESHKATEKAGKGFKLFGIAVGSILTAETLIKLGEKAWEFGKECNEAADRAEMGFALLKNTLKNLKDVGGPTFEVLDAKAKKLSQNTIFSTEQILRGSTQGLLMFRHVQGATFDKAQEAAVQVTAAFNGINASSEDLKGNASLIGRALENPIGGMMRLRSIGVIFSQGQKALIKSLVEQGNLEAAQQVILKQIYENPKIKGAAEALANTGEGVKRRLANQMEEMKISIGNAINPFIDKILMLGLKVMPIVQRAIEKLTPLFDALMSLLEAVWPLVEELTNSSGGLGSVLEIVVGILKFFVDGVVAIVNFIKPAIMAMSGMIKVVGIMIATFIVLNAVLALNPFIAIAMGIILLIGIIVNLVKHWDEVKKAVADFIKKAVEGIKQFVHNIWTTISKLLDNPIIKALGLIFLPFITIPALIVKNWSSISKFFGDLFKSIGDNPFVKAILGMFNGKSVDVNAPQPAGVPPASGAKIDVNAQSQFSVYTEKNMKVVPYKKTANLGYQGAM